MIIVNLRHCTGLLMPVLVLLLSLTACKRNEPTSWDSDLIVPLANGRLTLNNVVADSLLYVDENNLWHLRFERDLADFNLDSIITIEDTTVALDYLMPLTITLEPGTQSPVDIERDITFNAQSALLRHAHLSGGTLEYILHSEIQGEIVCNFYLPGLSRNGVSEVISIETQPGNEQQPYTTSGTIDLKDYVLDLTGINANGYNTFNTRLELAVAADAAGPANIQQNDVVSLELRFINPTFSFAQGYFGQHNYDLNESVDLSSATELPSGTLDLNGTTMRVKLRNAVGMDAQIQFNGLQGTDANGQMVSLQHDPLFLPLNINRAQWDGSNLSAVEFDYFLDSDNSNLNEFIEALPRQLNIGADVVLNPLGNVTDGNDFIFTDDALSAKVELDIPLRIGMEGLKFRDTLTLSNEPIEEQFDGELFLAVVNDFPCSANCKLLIIGNEGNEVITESALIDAAAPTTVIGQTISAESLIAIPVNQTIIDRLNKDNKLLIEITLNTPQGNVVGIYSGYGIDFRLIADGEYTIRIGE